MDGTPPRLLPGSLFAGRFRVLEHIAHGSMGSVYKVDDAGRIVALKVLKVTGVADGKAARRFEREVLAGARSESQHLTRTLDSGIDRTTGFVWLAMEYLQGCDLEKYVADKAPLALAEVRLIALQLFDAISSLHRAGLVHRDLKPANVIVEMRDDAPFVKVLDFGITKSYASSEVSATQAGLGTPLWTAPEQNNQGYVPDPNSDVWALGLIMFFLITGTQYWRHANDSAPLAELLMEILREPIIQASSRAQELGALAKIPAGFDKWFERAVNRDPARRFRDAGEAMIQLETILRNSAASARRYVWALTIAVLAAGLAVLTAYFVID